MRNAQLIIKPFVFFFTFFFPLTLFYRYTGIFPQPGEYFFPEALLLSPFQWIYLLFIPLLSLAVLALPQRKWHAWTSNNKVMWIVLGVTFAISLLTATALSISGIMLQSEEHPFLLSLTQSIRGVSIFLSILVALAWFSYLLTNNNRMQKIVFGFLFTGVLFSFYDLCHTCQTVRETAGLANLFQYFDAAIYPIFLGLLTMLIEMVYIKFAESIKRRKAE